MSLIESDVMYRHLVQGVVDYAIYMLNPDGTVANWNPGAERAKGYTPSEIIGRHFSCFYTAADQAAGVPQRGLNIALNTGKFEAEGWRVRKDGTLFWAHVVIDAIRDEQGGLRGFAKITRDCSERREKEKQVMLAKSLAERYSKEMEDLSRFLEAVIANIPSSVVVMDGISRSVVLANRQAEAILGHDRSSLVGKPIQECVPGTLGEIIERLTDEALKSDSSVSEEAEVETAKGPRILRANGLVFRGNDPRTRHVLLIADDVTEERAAAARVRHMAHHDTLTGTPNRRLFRDLLFKALNPAEGKRTTAVFCLDLDRFKNVNDTLGHHIGDVLLRRLTERLGDALRPNDTLARWGGDEFAVVLPDVTDVDELKMVSERLIAAAQEPFEIDGHSLAITISIGVAMGQSGEADVDEMMRYADLALYEAKRLGRSRVEFFHEEMEVISRKRREVEMDLRQAIVSRQLSLYYQPIVDGSETPRVVAREALIRWNHPQRGMVMPGDFIGIAEESGLIHEVGAFALHEACTEAMSWDDDARVAVNISPVQFSNGALTTVVMSALEKTGLPANRLELEITESVLLVNSNANLAELNTLKQLGVKISLDDFGTGYSSLGYLRSFDFDCIKIDRSFTFDVDSSPESLAIVRAINGIGRSLNIPTTAEGVETPAQMERLVGEGCSMFQGFYLGRPAPGTAVVSDEARTG